MLKRQNDLWKGFLPDNWSYHFHGSDCKFENGSTNQILEVRINQGKNYGILNASTLLWFIETTNEYKVVYQRIKGNDILTECLILLEQENFIIDIGEFGYKSFILNKKRF